MPGAEQSPAPELEVVDERADAEGEDLLAVVVSRIAGIESRLAETTRLGGRSADHIDQLLADNRRLRQGELSEAMAPLLRDLIGLIDDLDRMSATAADAGDDLELVRDKLIEVLARNGVERYLPAVGDSFDSTRHSVAGTAPTGDETVNRTIAETQRAGYAREDGTPVRVAEVAVLVYEKPEEGTT